MKLSDLLWKINASRIASMKSVPYIVRKDFAQNSGLTTMSERLTDVKQVGIPIWTAVSILVIAAISVGTIAWTAAIQYGGVENAIEARLTKSETASRENFLRLETSMAKLADAVALLNTVTATKTSDRWTRLQQFTWCHLYMSPEIIQRGACSDILQIPGMFLETGSGSMAWAPRLEQQQK